MKRLASLTIIGALIACSQPSSAQTGSSASANFTLPSGQVPTEIFGVPCTTRAGDANFAPSLRCEPKDLMKQPSISISVADWRSTPTRAEMIANMREAFHERAMFNVVREEPFAPPSDPAATGFRALYQTELGNRYVWVVLSKGKLTRAMVAVFAPTDFKAMSADVEAKVFGVLAKDLP